MPKASTKGMASPPSGDFVCNLSVIACYIDLVFNITFNFSRTVIGDPPNGTNQRFEIFTALIYMFLGGRAR